MCSTKTWTTMQYNTIQYNQLPSPPKNYWCSERLNEWLAYSLIPKKISVFPSYATILRYDFYTSWSIDRKSLYYGILKNSACMCLQQTNDDKHFFLTTYLYHRRPCFGTPLDQRWLSFRESINRKGKKTKPRAPYNNRKVVERSNERLFRQASDDRFQSTTMTMTIEFHISIFTPNLPNKSRAHHYIIQK